MSTELLRLSFMNPGRPFFRHLARILTASTLLLLISGAGILQAGGAGKVTAYKSQIDLPTYPWAAVKHPYFRGTDKVNIYPYPMLDFLSREKTNRTYRTVVLENEYLRITFLPELGGKIYEVIDKTVGKPTFYVNHVVKPGLIGQCGAWTSGGVEWNTGPQGHTVSCMQPVPVVILPAEKDGSQSVAVGETERIYGTRWTVIVTLRPGRSFIEERIRIYNPTEYIRPYYFWNCAASPNTPGFRFIYPMTLGCDHAGEKFFQWPIDHGKDLTRGTNYQDASSIFAWHCDQDFFGSYNDDLDHGVVSYANHHQLPGKKAWTWGQGGFGKMHQMDLTDDDGPYNEVQTGPLLTQAQVGRLDPCQAVEWKEWWYPIHGIGGFTFANKDVAVNATIQDRELHLKMIGTGNWSPVDIRFSDGLTPAGQCKLSPTEVAEVVIPTVGGTGGATLFFSNQKLARFEFPPSLPRRSPPEKKPGPETASEFAVAGWQELLFARTSEAESDFRKALEKDAKSVDAKVGLVFLQLDSDPARSAEQANSALATDPENGLARFALASAQYRYGEREALNNAWLASRAQETAAAGRALAAKLVLTLFSFSAEPALSGHGPWETDVLCRSRRAFLLLKNGDPEQAVQLARANLEVEPLDLFSRCLLWLAKAEDSVRFEDLIGNNPELVLEVAGQFLELGDREVPMLLLQTYFERVPPPARDPLPAYLAWGITWSPFGPKATPKLRVVREAYTYARAQQSRGLFPCDFTTLLYIGSGVSDGRPVDSELLPPDGKAALYRGHLLFHLGRYAEGREQWKRAAELGAEPVIAYRALGMAAKTLDGDLKTAREWLEKAHQADPTDAIVARDLANVLFALADKCESASEKNQLLTQARDRLKAAFQQGKARSDFVALLARAQNRLGEFGDSAHMLDTVRVTVWEGAHEVHDLFEEAHLALGEADLKSGHPGEALAEFNRALEYPANLATGKLENAHEAHIHLRRGNALAALGRKQDAIAAWKLAADAPESSDTRITEARQKAKEALDNSAR
jgi:tetratricopeptide (TPR) repeat protein